MSTPIEIIRKALGMDSCCSDGTTKYMGWVKLTLDPGDAHRTLREFSENLINLHLFSSITHISMCNIYEYKAFESESFTVALFDDKICFL